VLAVVVLALSVAAPLAAKGPTTKLVITGPGISAPIDVTSAAAIAPSVFGGEFIGPPATEPPALWKRYTIRFHVMPPRETTARPMYQVLFTRDPLSGEAFIYLPSLAEPAGRMNRHTIVREGHDGHWHRASPAWAGAIAAALP
jgi:hypothetical protein